MTPTETLLVQALESCLSLVEREREMWSGRVKIARIKSAKNTAQTILESYDHQLAMAKAAIAEARK